MDIQIDTSNDNLGDIHINEAGANARIFINGDEYFARPAPVKFFRTVKDRDDDWWVELDTGTSGHHWRMLQISSRNAARKDTLADVIEDFGPLVTE